MKTIASFVLAVLFGIGATASAQQETALGAELRLEGDDLKADCGSFKSIASCATTLVTDHPIHLSLGSIAPQNGFGAGPALILHFTADNWRDTWSSDAVFATGGAWRAGTYFKAIHTAIEPPHPVTPGTATRPIRITEYPVFDVYAQAISLPTVDFYGIGPDSLLADKSSFGMKELVVGTGATLPIGRFAAPLRLAILAEVNGRFFDVTSVDNEPAYAQFGEGVRLRPQIFNDRLRFDYTFRYQQYVASESSSTFMRWTVDLNHEVPIYHTSAPALRRDTNTPNECSQSPTNHACPSPTRDRWGTIGFRLLASESQVGADAAVPFYLQRTLGGSDIDGNRMLASYADYRFRGPHVLLMQETFEHAIWGPIGALVQAEQGKVANQADGLDFRNLLHTETFGVTLRAGGFPALSASWSTGGPEGHHVIVVMDTALLGGGGRPALQ